MVKKTFLYIFIYTLLVGCGTDYMMGWNDDLIYSCNDKSGGMNVYSDLYMDINNYYHLNYEDGYNQTFATIYGEIEEDGYYEKMLWFTNRNYCWEQYGNDSPVCTPLINESSYSDAGLFRTILGVQEEFIGDTIRVYGSYDKCSIIYKDSIEVIIDE